jgi:hypothetical protein
MFTVLNYCSIITILKYQYYIITEAKLQALRAPAPIAIVLEVEEKSERNVRCQES